MKPIEDTGKLRVTARMVAGMRTLFVKRTDTASLTEQLPVLVLLHGFAGGAALFYQTFLPLSNHFRVIAVDWLGCGGSSRDPPFRASTVRALTVCLSVCLCLCQSARSSLCICTCGCVSVCTFRKSRL